MTVPSTAKETMKRCRARDLGIEVGVMKTGPLNAITDVAGIKVGHQTIIRGKDIRTGVTAILPHSGNLYQEKVPAAIHLFNSYGKLAGYSQVEELGNIETPIVLTNTLSVGTAVTAVVRYTLQQPGNEAVGSVNAVVGETNDGYLNDIRGLHVKEKDVLKAIHSANGGKILEGSIGAGTGTRAFGYKGGIGSSSRMIPKPAGNGRYTVGVLLQSNFGWILNLNGVPFTREMKQTASKKSSISGEDGSCMIVIATDAPLSSRNLKRLAKRAFSGMARTRSVMSNSSGDYAIAFSTAYRIANSSQTGMVRLPPLISNDHITPFFHAVEEATQEAIYNSLFMATTISGYQERTVQAIPLTKVAKICEKYNMLNIQKELKWTPYSEQ